jgi:hypothetical protein
MRHRIAIALATAMIAGMASAALAETVNGVTILRGTPVPPANSPAGIGSGSSIPPGNPYYRADQSGSVNSVHTGSANAGGQFNNLPAGAGR